MPKISTIIPWQKLFRSENGQIGVGSVFFYASSLLIVLSIPVTVVLLRSNQEQITTASFSPVSFSNPPTMQLDLPEIPARKGEAITVKATITNANWSIIFFSPTYPTASHPYEDHPMAIAAQGPNISEAYHMVGEPGYFMAVAFQLQGAYGEFRSGDLMCTWDGQLYLYRKETVNPIVEFIDSDAKYRGEWDKITTCQNNSVKRLDVH